MTRAARQPRLAIDVVLDARELGALQRVGTLFRQDLRTDLPASFEYAQGWLQSARRFMLDPRLDLWPGEQHPPRGAAAFGILLDSAPDRWGRVLLERREAAVADREHRKVRSLQELDLLLGVPDETRAGALRFRGGDKGPFFDDSSELAAPPVTSLAELAHISERLESPGAEKLKSYEKWLAMLIAPGSSLGGARPKANFTDADGGLWIAKFPSRDDRYDVGAWEFLVHGLARAAGIEVPSSRLEKLSQRYRTFCVARFDRARGRRRMFASAMTLLERADGEGGSYLELAEFLSDQGAQGHIEEDLAQLFRRVVFNVLVGNRDDHLRNHGFIRAPTGWRLSPAFDMNPNPNKIEHALTLDGRAAMPSSEAVLATADLYRLNRRAAAAVVSKVHAVIRQWRPRAQELGLSRPEIQRMEDVFAP